LQCPTTIVPFFGDQPFWGDQVHARGLGTAPIPIDQFGLQKLVDAIKYMMKPEVSSAIFMVYVVQGVQILLPFHPFECMMQI
jgi:hypothetical protein